MEKDWNYWKDYYLEWGELESHKRRIERSIFVIEKFLKKGLKNYISFSGGKDSCVLLHLISKIDNSIPVVSVLDDMDYPEQREFNLNFCRKLKVKLEILEPEISLFEHLKTVDFIDCSIHDRGTSVSDDFFFNLVRNYQKKNNVTGQFWGVRADESRSRKLNYRLRGDTYYNKSINCWVCSPLSHLKGEDVFAYLLGNNVPFMEVYKKTKFVESPHHIRIDGYIPHYKGASKGGYMWLKYHYPELYNKLYSINRKVSKYV